MVIQSAQNNFVNEGQIGVQSDCANRRSFHLLAQACEHIAGGDSSTMRVLPYHIPLVAERGKGSRLWDVDGNEYIDLNMAYGPLLLGHCAEPIINSVTRQISQNGSQLGFPTEISSRVAEKIKRLYPSMELMRFANSGTEAIASSVRLARTYTGREKLIVFEGHYHGWSDALFHRYHAEIADLPECGYAPAIPGTNGMSGAPNNAIVVRWNDLDLFEQVMKKYGSEVAAVIMEPVMGNAGLIPPDPQFLAGVREVTQDHDSLLIFDEVITGFRVHPQGAQELYGVYPDITIVSKAMGGGYPVAAFGASKEIMNLIVEGTLFHGGVYSANATVMAASEAVLDTVLERTDEIYGQINSVSEQLAAGFREILNRRMIPHLVHQVGGVLSLLLTDGQIEKVTNYRDVKQHCQFEKYIQLQHFMQRAGVYFHPNQFEPMFLSSAHSKEDIETVLNRFDEAVRNVWL
ncbi:MAG: aspartate aminotransferase family protein [Planctomycetaceae bacterium]|nr:aspartate aminotransferase family protein [Planctomycetaceae bacterium]